MSSVVARGISINYAVLGKAPPAMIAIHGLGLDNMSSFYFTIAPELARQARVLLYDLRGHGRSQQPQSPYTIEALAEDAGALLDVTGFEQQPVIVLAHSFGGAIALRFALLYPQRAAALVLIEGLTATPEFGTRLAETLTAPQEEQERTVRELFGNWVSLQEARGRAEDVSAISERAQRLHRQRHSRSLLTLKGLLQETSLIMDLAATPAIDSAELARIGCPVLALYGRDSDVREEGERLARKIPQCDLKLLPGGHNILWDGGREMAAAINDWVHDHHLDEGRG